MLLIDIYNVYKRQYLPIYFIGSAPPKDVPTEEDFKISLTQPVSKLVGCNGVDTDSEAFTAENMYIVIFTMLV